MPLKQLKFLGFLALLVIGFIAQFLNQPTVAAGYFRLVALDVGQGDALLITTPLGKHIVIDGGPAEDVVGKVRRYIGSNNIELVVATHNDADHISGLSAIVNHFQVSEAWISGAIHTTHTFERWLNSLRENSVPTKTVLKGKLKEIDGVQFEVLHPMEDFSGLRPEHNHDATIVIKVSYGATSFLLTGDLEEANELEMIDKDPSKLGASVLKVSHHGSKYSSKDKFLEYVHPEIALISTGKDNSYGHPAEETLKRLEQAGAKVLRTDYDGDLVIFSDGAKVWLDE